MSQELGYKIIKVSIPTSKNIDDALAATEHLTKFQQSVSSLGFEKLGWNTACENIFLDGFDFKNDEYLKSILQKPLEDISVESNIVIWMENVKQLRRVKAGRGRVYIYRALGETLGSENGFFRIINGSHKMRTEDLISASATLIHLLSDEAIIVDGDVVIEYPQTGGGIGLLKVFSKS